MRTTVSIDETVSECHGQDDTSGLVHALVEVTFIAASTAARRTTDAHRDDGDDEACVETSLKP